MYTLVSHHAFYMGGGVSLEETTPDRLERFHHRIKVIKVLKVISEKNFVLIRNNTPYMNPYI